MPTIDLPGAFVNNVGSPLSATYLNAIRRAAIELDGWSYRVMPAFDSSAGEDTKTAGQYTNSNPPLRIWKGYFKWRTGFTTLTIVGRTSGAPVGAVVKTYLNGSGSASDTIASPLPATFTRTISISSGYTDGQIVQIEIKIETALLSTMEVVVLDIYASPITYSPTWPGTPTFSGTYDATKLNQLISACNWLFGRMDATPFVPRRATVFALGPSYDPTLLGAALHAHWPLWYGGVQRSYTDSKLRVVGTFTNVTSVGIRYTIYINGSLAHTSSTFGPGTWPIYDSVALTNTVGTRTEVSIFAEVVDAGPNAPWQFSRWSLLLIREEPSTGYPYASPPTAFVQGSIPVATLNSRLNAISTILANTYTRIIADTHVWGRAHAVRWWYGRDDRSNGNLFKRAPIVFERGMDRLIVAGRGGKIEFGAFQVPSDPAKEADDYTFSQSSDASPADKEQTLTVWLDSIPGLDQGLAFYVTGENTTYAEGLLSP